MPITRRDMLRGGLIAAACAAVPTALRRASAQGPATTRNLLIVLNYGGWDTTYVLDPKPGSPMVDTPDGALARRGDLTWWSHESRPSVDRFFERWGDLACIVNGVQVRSFVHTDCIKRVMTGSPSETTPDMGAIAAWELGRDLPVPYLALGNQARSGPLASITGRAGTTNQLNALIDPASAYAAPGGLGPSPGLEVTDAENGRVMAYLAASAERMRRARAERGYNQRRIDDFVSSLDRADRLGRFVSGGGGLSERDYTVDLAVQIPLAVRAIEEGLSHTALVQSGYDWDTHQDNARQSMFHEGLYGNLDDLMTELDDRRMLDQTLVVVLSEMGRTPRLNSDRGKDHWPVSSCIVLGGGVRGGRVLGGTNDELGALSLDLATGAPDSAGKQLQASNLVAGVLSAIGVDTSTHLPSVEAFDAFAA